MTRLDRDTIGVVAIEYRLTRKVLICADSFSVPRTQPYAVTLEECPENTRFRAPNKGLQAP